MKAKTVTTTKVHKCWACGKKIEQGDLARASKVFPNESKSMGMIDVNKPLYILTHVSRHDCNKAGKY